MFDLRFVATSGATTTFETVLDASVPYLDDHRPGNDPLFGTTMGIALMTQACSAVTPGKLWMPFDIELTAPVIVPAETEVVANVHVVSSPNECLVTVETFSDDGHVRGHCSASFRASVVVDTRGHSDYRPTVASPAVYGLFFHGPAFQVVHSAALNDGDMWCEIAPTVASLWERGARGEPVAAQQIELCLQTAGLLEVATSERMMIPKRISCIDRGTGNPSASRIARARRSGQDSFDIELWDDAQQLVCRVVGYETQPLPFSSDAVALRELAAVFNAV